MIDNTIEKVELWHNYRETNDVNLRNALFIKYSDLAVKTAMRLAPKYKNYIHIDDLISYGNIGLIDAIEKFDIDMGVKFETYASIRIRGAIIDEIRKLDWVPRSTRQKFKLMEQTIADIENKLGRVATTQEIAEHLSMLPKDVDHILEQMNSHAMISMDDKIIEIINENLEKNLQDKELTPEELVVSEELRENLGNSIDGLPERERLIINLYYYEEFTLREIGEVLGVTESRVSQLHSRALLKLRESLDTPFKA